MSTVVCSKDCKYRKAVFCGRDIVNINQLGLCDVWWDKNGGMRQVPFYAEEARPMDASKSDFRTKEKMDSATEEKVEETEGESK